MKNFALITALTIALTACNNEVSFDTLETNLANAKANAEYNAQKFRAESPRWANTALEVQGDSTQTPKCPQGDGWASAKLVSKENPASAIGLKCSTVSGTVGCLLASDFATKPTTSTSTTATRTATASTGRAGLRGLSADSVLSN